MPMSDQIKVPCAVQARAGVSVPQGIARNALCDNEKIMQRLAWLPLAPFRLFADQLVFTVRHIDMEMVAMSSIGFRPQRGPKPQTRRRVGLPQKQ